MVENDTNSESESNLRRIMQALRGSFIDFMTHTSTHGAKYIGEDDRRLFERFFWVMMIGLGYATTGFMVVNIYNRYTASPTKTILEHTHYPTWKLPFPAVTVCNNNRVQRTRAHQFVKSLTIPDHITRQWVLYSLRSLIEINDPEIAPTAEFASLQDVLDANNLNIQDVMLNLTQPCGEMLERCSWQSQIVECTSLFEIRKSHLGFCCSFNYIGIPDSNSRKESHKTTEPLHTPFIGQDMGMTMLINPAVDDYFVSSFLSKGVAVLIHDSFVYPGEQIIMKMVPVNKEVLIPIRMTKRICSDDVMDLSANARECLLAHENHLELFSHYLDDNCITECRMNYSLQRCTCIPYIYPASGKHRICNLADSHCLYENFEFLHTFMPGIAAEERLIVEQHQVYLNAAKSRVKSMKCDCPSQCEGVSLEARISLGDFNASGNWINQLVCFSGGDTNTTNRILLHAYLESKTSQVNKRDVSTTTPVLLGLLGGICSLFLGCSFVTPIELTYFWSIRLPEFFRRDPVIGTPCPASPKHIRNSPSIPVSDTRDLRFPSVRKQNKHAKVIEILPPELLQN